METIKNYLENMFMNMQNTPEVKKAKTELLSMMEDKYHELKSEGKSENEAIGIVISEFGNLQELAEELGIKDNMEVRSNNQDGLYISMEDAKTYCQANEKFSLKIAIAVMLCICSPILLIILGGFEEAYHLHEAIATVGGLIPLFLLVASAVVIFIISGVSMSKYERYKTQRLNMDFSTESYLREKKESENMGFAIRIAIGVFLCITGVIPVILSGCIDLESDLPVCIAIGLMLAIISIAVFLFITAGCKRECYNVLLQEDDYTVAKKDATNPINVISGVYWSIIVSAYLIWSFISMDWHITWIIWPVAGVLFGAITAICQAITGKKYE